MVFCGLPRASRKFFSSEKLSKARVNVRDEIEPHSLYSGARWSSARMPAWTCASSRYCVLLSTMRFAAVCVRDGACKPGQGTDMRKRAPFTYSGA